MCLQTTDGSVVNFYCSTDEFMNSYNLYFVYHWLSVCPWGGHCIVCPQISNYVFWLPLLNLQSFLHILSFNGGYFRFTQKICKQKSPNLSFIYIFGFRKIDSTWMQSLLLIFPLFNYTLMWRSCWIVDWHKTIIV